MARILHISDAHLGKPAPWQQLADDKSGLFGRKATTTQTILKDTLRAFRDSPDGANVDAVIFSGDITNYGGEDGYKALTDLSELLPAGLAPERVLIVPGNHDVDWEAAEGTEERYRHWL